MFSWRPLLEASTPSWKFLEHFVLLSNYLSYCTCGSESCDSIIINIINLQISGEPSAVLESPSHSGLLFGQHGFHSQSPFLLVFVASSALSHSSPSPQLSHSPGPDAVLWTWFLNQCVSLMLWPTDVWYRQTFTKSPSARGKQLYLPGARIPPLLKSWLCFVGQPAPIIKKHFSAKSRAMIFPAHRQGSLTTELSSYWQGRENENHGNLISLHYADLI